jgi:methylated-DNA-protein-cysteine methyltransferase-like protein
MHRREICFLYRVLPFAVLSSPPNHCWLSKLKVLNTPHGFLSLPPRKPQPNLVTCRCDIGSEVVNEMSWDIVYRVVKQIPRGRVLSYGALAKVLRLPGGARSAGRAMAATPSGKGIPWHRVVGERGKILIREPYASLQKKLLESEGVKVIESRVDLKAHLWKPAAKTIAKTPAPKVKRLRRPGRK